MCRCVPWSTNGIVYKHAPPCPGWLVIVRVEAWRADHEALQAARARLGRARDELFAAEEAMRDCAAQEGASGRALRDAEALASGAVSTYGEVAKP